MIIGILISLITLFVFTVIMDYYKEILTIMNTKMHESRVSIDVSSRPQVRRRPQDLEWPPRYIPSSPGASSPPSSPRYYGRASDYTDSLVREVATLVETLEPNEHDEIMKVIKDI